MRVIAGASVAAVAMLVLAASCSSGDDGSDQSASTSAPAATSSRPVLTTTSAPQDTTSFATTTTSEPVRRPSEWVTSDASAATYLTWTVADTSVVGSVQIAQLADDEQGVASSPLSFTGTLVDDAFTLTVGSQVWNGIIDGDLMTITYPATSGDLRQMMLVPGSIADFNAALDTLRNVAARNVDIATQSSIAAAETAQIAQIFNDLRVVTINLDDELATVDRFANLDAAVSTVAGSAAAARALDGGDCIDLSYSIGTVEYDVGTVEHEVRELEFEVEQITQMRDDITVLAEQLDPYAETDDLAFAVFAGEDAAERATAEIAVIRGRIDTALEQAQDELDSVAPLDDTC